MSLFLHQSTLLEIHNGTWHLASEGKNGPLMKGSIHTLNEYKYFTEMVVICDKSGIPIMSVYFVCLVIADIP